MGPLFVLIIWGVVATVLSVISGAILVGLVSFMTRGVPSGRKRACTIAGLLPAAGFAYLFACIMLFSIWSSVRGRDWGWGDSWDTPLTGNYHLNMIDVTDNGTIYNVADPDGSGNRDHIADVRQLEVRPPFLLGEYSPETFGEAPAKPSEPLFFILDTKSGIRTDEPSLAALQQAALQLGKPLDMKSVDEVYGEHRYDRLDLIPATLFVFPPIIVLFLLLRALIWLRRTRLPSDLQ